MNTMCLVSYKPRLAGPHELRIQLNLDKDVSSKNDTSEKLPTVFDRDNLFCFKEYIPL